MLILFRGFRSGLGASRRTVLAVLAIACLQTLSAAEDAQESRAASLAPAALPEAVERLKNEKDEAWQAYVKHAQATQKKLEKALDLALELARKEPPSEQGFEAFAWWLSKASENRSINFAEELTELSKRYAAEPGIGRVLAEATATRSHHDYQLIPLCELVLEKNPKASARGAAAFALARTKRWHTLRALTQANHTGDHLEAATEAGATAFRELVTNYGTQPDLSPGAAGRTLAEAARPYLFELQRLRFGEPAPDIEGVDLSGAPLKLSGFRGQVVYLVFWSSEDPRDFVNLPMMAKNLRDRPFTIVGVNLDADREQAKRAESKYALPWRSFRSGPASQKDSIADTWNARDPRSTYYYLIDDQGVFRRLRYSGSPTVEQQIEAIVLEAEKRK
jgi:peroxiredoxin